MFLDLIQFIINISNLYNIRMMISSPKLQHNFQTLRAHLKAHPDLYVLANSSHFNTKERLLVLPDEDELLREIVGLVPGVGKSTYDLVFRKLSEKSKARLRTLNDLYYYMTHRQDIFQPTKTSVARAAGAERYLK